MEKPRRRVFANVSARATGLDPGFFRTLGRRREIKGAKTSLKFSMVYFPSWRSATRSAMRGNTSSIARNTVGLTIFCSSPFSVNPANHAWRYALRILYISAGSAPINVSWIARSARPNVTREILPSSFSPGAKRPRSGLPGSFSKNQKRRDAVSPVGFQSPRDA